MSRRPNILVVDDDSAIRSSLEDELRALDYDVHTASNGREGVAACAAIQPDLVLSDLAMPVADGFELIAAIRKTSETPIIVLSVRGGDSDKIRALDLGADDFVVKPFSLPELLARIRAQLRRRAAGHPQVLEFPELTIDLDRRRVVQGVREIKLTPTELALLELLATHAGRPVTIDDIIARVWKAAPGTTSDTVRVHMSSLRRKIEPDSSNPQYIVTEPWVGYRFIAEPT
ncbi:MAG TPA: response regulator transcription factor [Thermoanaerobaculia bacterium]|nr:response regulator transcription factor [Thermoanaerobaculia bacterium]